MRDGKRHEVWGIPGSNRETLIARHRGEVPTGTLRSILRDLGLTQEDLHR
ncbi:MAG: toxin HicA [SAR202 cluster bacterium]|nr:toxin HicA [SAR202 cluster bacterium]